MVPLDSKFGLAWRDWRVLTEMTRRTGQVAYAQAADAIADLLDDPATDRQVETLQDRIHRLYAWWLIDKDHFAARIKAEAEALLALQNPDGGWHELDRKPGPERRLHDRPADLDPAQARLSPRRPPDRPGPGLPARPAAAVRRLVPDDDARELPDPDARDPLRRRGPRRGLSPPRSALEGLGQPRRRARPSSLATGSIVATLDDLENLWDVPEADRPDVRPGRSSPLLDHPEPLVRARAAACLGRIGDPSAVEPLVGRLGDPSKIVWRSAAWALRRLGNRGLGIEAIKAALDSPDPATRRGAVADLRLPVLGDGRPARPGRPPDRADGRPRPLDPAPGAPVAPPVVLPVERRRLPPADRRRLPRPDGRARRCRSSARR